MVSLIAGIYMNTAAYTKQHQHRRRVKLSGWLTFMRKREKRGNRKQPKNNKALIGPVWDFCCGDGGRVYPQHQQ